MYELSKFPDMGFIQTWSNQ